MRKEMDSLLRQKDSEIDTSDIPEVKNWRGGQRGKLYRIKTAIWVDPAGSMGETSEQQIKRAKDYYEDELGVKLNVHTPQNISEIEEGTDLVLFDYGGMMYGNSLAEDNSRRLVRWAEDHPSALVIVVSTFTFDRAFRYAIEEHLNTAVPYQYSKPDGKRHKTPMHNVVVQECSEDFIPAWFRKAHGCSAPIVGTLTMPSDEPSALAGLPSQTFFNPKKSFLSFMARKFAKQFIFDVGAGVGHVAEALSKTKKFKKVFAIDMLEREGGSAFPVYMADAASFPYPSGCIVMLCRPCHGSFVETVIDQAIECKAGAIVYVGLGRNVKTDLGMHYSKFKKVASNVGRDKENIWLSTLAKKGKQ